MAPLLLAICLGIALGLFVNHSQWKTTLGRLQKFFLLLMLFLLGAKLGADGDIQAHLFTIGIRALVLSSFTVAGSVCTLYCLKLLMIKGAPTGLTRPEKVEEVDSC